MTIIEGRWRCPRCNRENLGRHLECLGCGDPRDDGVQFYLPEETPEVSDGHLLEQAKAGSDRLCEFCDASNPPQAEVCEGCGAPLTQRRREEHYQPLAGPTPAVSAPPVRAQRRAKGGRRWGCLAVLGLLGVVGAMVLGGSLLRSDVTATVTSMSWQRSLEAEKLVSVTRTGWQDQLPAGARPLEQRRAVRSQRQVQIGTEGYTETEQFKVQVGTEKVKVGTRDLGNGFFEDVYEERPVYENRSRQVTKTRPVYRQDPVYDTEVTYQVDEWQVVRTANASGSGSDVQWPNLVPGERERAGSRRESYQVLLRAGSKTFTYRPATVEYPRFAVGTRWVARVDKLGRVHSVRPAGG